MACIEFKDLSCARAAISDHYQNVIEFYPKGKKRRMDPDMILKIWRMGEDNFGPQGAITDGTKSFVNFEARWILFQEKAVFKSDSDAVMMFFLFDQLKVDQMAAT